MPKDYYDVYLARCSRDGKTERDLVKSRIKENFNNFLKISPNSVEVVIGSSNEKLKAIVVTNKDDETKSYKDILTSINSPLNIGELIFWKDKVWLIMQQDSTVIEGYNKYIGLECRHKIEWINADSIKEESWCYLVAQTDEKIKGTFKVINDIVSTVPDKNLSVVMPYRKIDKGQRLMIDDTAWEINETDFISVKGLIYISALESRKNIFTDDKHLNDVNNIKSTYIDTENVIQVSINDNYIFNPTLYRNNKQVDSNFTYVIDNLDIAVMENNIVIPQSLGTARVTITPISEPNLSKVVDIEIVATSNITKELEIIGDNVIKANQTKEYLVNYYKNGVLEESAPIVIEIETNDLATAIVAGNKVTVETVNQNVVGNIVITATYDDKSIKKEIQFKSLWG